MYFNRVNDSPSRLRADIFHHIAIHIRQSEIPPCVPIRQLFVVESEQVQNRCVQVVDGDSVSRPP